MEDLSRKTHELIKEMAKNAYKNTIPADMRIFGKSIISPGPVNEKDFRGEELDALRDAYFNSQQRAKSPNTQAAQKAVQSFKTNYKNPNQILNSPFNFSDIPKKLPASDVLDILQRMASKDIQYNDYPVKTKNGMYNDMLHIVYNSFTDPSFSMANTVGRAKTYTDKQGNLHIGQETYDFNKLNKKSALQHNSTTSPTYRKLREIAPSISKPMDVDINLGNPKSWKGY